MNERMSIHYINAHQVMYMLSCYHEEDQTVFTPSYASLSITGYESYVLFN